MGNREANSGMRVALWGFGEHARRNLVPALRASSNARLVSVCSRTATSLDAIPGVEITDAPGEILEDEGVDVILIASQTGAHLEMASRALDHGKHVWCEKPMTTTSKDTRQLVERAVASGLVCMETDMFLHHPLHGHLREIVTKRTLGDVKVITARFGFPHLEPGNFRYSARAGGGALLDAGFYPLAAVVDLIGDDVSLMGAMLEHQDGFEVDTGGSVLVEGSESLVGHVDWGFGRSYRNEIEIWAERGHALAKRAFSKPPSLVTRIEKTLYDGEQVEVEVPPANQFALMIDHFSEITSDVSRFDPTPVIARAALMEAVRSS